MPKASKYASRIRDVVMKIFSTFSAFSKLRKRLMKQKKLINVLIAGASLACIISFSFKAVAQNNYFSGGFSPASGSAGRVIRQVPESSLAPQQYYTNYVKRGADAWNGITYKISISSSSSGAYDARAKVVNGSDFDRAGLLVPYCNQGSGSTCINSKWNAAEVIGYNNVMDFYNFNGTNKLQVWMHEFGHLLSMAHIPESDPQSNAVMHPTVPSIYGIQSRDRQSLRNKWGS